MTSRERFEAKVTETLGVLWLQRVDQFPDGDKLIYAEQVTRHMWDAWQTAERQAIDLAIETVRFLDRTNDALLVSVVIEELKELLK